MTTELDVLMAEEERARVTLVRNVDGSMALDALAMHYLGRYKAAIEARVGAEVTERLREIVTTREAR